MPRRWHQVGTGDVGPNGPDTPRRRWWQESPITRESTKEAVKTIAQGMPGVSGVTVVSNSCAFYFCTRGCGRSGRPAFPAPSHFRGTMSVQNLGHILCRGNAIVCSAVIACDKREAFAQGSESDDPPSLAHASYGASGVRRSVLTRRRKKSRLPCCFLDRFANARDDGL
jgi:hypothetical protein